MLLLRTFISTVAITIAANLGLCFCGCARAEYEIDGECCPMCAPGTTCVPCPASTYTDEPNSRISCFPCTVCDPVYRLKVRKDCTHSADTTCEPQEGFHCIKLNKDSCALAVEHSACNPGQYIKQTGRAFSDTVCADCTDGTYSDGSLMACLPHSKCETMGLTEVKAGTTSSDAECEKVISLGVIAGVIIAVTVASLLAYIIYRKAWGSNERVYIQQATDDP
ncbi:tumor necrosis factor receptor superfamily member 14-like [Onychostoma macrolepis]|uniref:tumor necrosis factor receptor superfamily member 14-like n=1 Tax=Onychostoma macrolepis TaxID=369639 RepID=UPI00272C2094|nr:tumor necrosis factor receptor superfamily member 14-like [Onychostoma macrolepis]